MDARTRSAVRDKARGQATHTVQTAQLRPAPAFITDKFALQMISELGGKASTKAIKEHIKLNFDMSKFPHGVDYLMTQYRSLLASGYVEIKRNKKEHDFEYSFTDEARPVIERLLKQN